MLDLIGYATIADDAKAAATLVDAFFVWLLGIPWWAVFGFALILTMWLMWVSWPRKARDEPRDPSETDKNTGAASDGAPIVINFNYGMRESTSKDTEFETSHTEVAAFISARIDNGLLVLDDSINVSSITDRGAGDFEVNFATALESKMMVAHPVGTTPQFEIVSISDSSVHLRFQHEPSGFKVRIDAPIDERNQRQ